MERPSESRRELTIAVLSEPHGDEVVLALSGELDAQSMYTLRDYIVYCLRRNHRRIRLEMTSVTRCDGGALYGVAGLQEALSAAGGRLRIAGVSEPVREARKTVTLRDDIFL